MSSLDIVVKASSTPLFSSLIWSRFLAVSLEAAPAAAAVTGFSYSFSFSSDSMTYVLTSVCSSLEELQPPVF